MTFNTTHIRMVTYLKRICAYFLCFCVATAALSTLPQGNMDATDSDSMSNTCLTCVYAEGDDDENKAILESVQSMEWLLKALYLIMWPLLAIAGASLDNALVYGEIFFLDTMLWKFRQVIRNFTNFAIGFVFVGSILMSFFYQNSEKFSLPKILKNTFIAGIVVQMSWFLVAVLLDLSTVAVLGLGALPLNVLGQSSDHVLSEVRYLKPHTLFNIDGTKEANRDYAEHSILYSCQDNSEVRYLACWVDQGKFLPSIPGSAEKDPKTRESYKFNVTEIWKGVAKTDVVISDKFCVWGLDLIETRHGEELTPLLVHEARTAAAENEMKQCSTLDKYVEKAAGLTGPLYVLFAVVMDMSEIATTGTNVSLTEAMFIFLIRVIIGLALLLPLFALCVVLIIRVVILWLIIAFSPVLSLLFIYNKKSEDAKIMGGNLTSVTDIMSLIFLPVVVVFAISMSLVFLTLITRADFIQDETSCAEDPLSLMGCELNEDKCKDDGGTREYDCFGMTLILTESESNHGANIINTMGWLVKSVLGIAIMRAIIFMALKTSKITAGVVSSIEGLGKKLAMATPIIPTGSGWMSVGGAQKTMEQLGQIPGRMQQKQYENSGMKDYIDAQMADYGGSANEVNKSMETAINSGDVSQVAGVLEKGGADNTNFRDYRQLPDALGMLGGHAQGTFTTVEEALKDNKVAKALDKRGLSQTFVDKWHNTGKYQNDVADHDLALAAGMELGKHTVEGTKADATVLNLHHVEHDDKHHYYELDENTKITHKDPYEFTSTIAGNMSENGLETLGKIIGSYGSIEAVPSGIWGHFDGMEEGNSLRDALIKTDKTESTFDYTYTGADGKEKKIGITMNVSPATEGESIRITGFKDVKVSEVDKKEETKKTPK